ncbi:hypothetical protein [Halosimplex salinum]|uniref:hypothetical protein n=1 Tax=Halosimplex salinum TaxID=1710538 RepID=UPI000F4718C0|nr:hypothetical protein [Halosimplex salinum]
MADDSSLLVGLVTAPFDAVSAFRARVRRSGLVQWLLFTGNRSVVTLVLLLAVFTAFVGLALARPVDMAQLLSETTTLQTLFQVLLRGAILVVSIVTSISSIVLSAEIADIMTEEERVDSSLEFRRRVEGLIDADVSPGRPADFLQAILHTVYQETGELRSVAGEGGNEAFEQEVQAFADDVAADARDAAETLDGAQFGTFRVLSAGLHYDYSWQLNTARRLEQQFGDSLTESQASALSDLIDTLKFFGTGREHFQSLYYKREMARLSATLLYVSLPVIVFISYLILALDGNIIPTVQVGPLSSLSVFVLFAYTVSLAPYVVLTAHVIRIAAVTLRTLSAGPFVLRSRRDHAVSDVRVEFDPEEWAEWDDGEEPVDSGGGDESMDSDDD